MVAGLWGKELQDQCDECGVVTEIELLQADEDWWALPICHPAMKCSGVVICLKKLHPVLAMKQDDIVHSIHQRDMMMGCDPRLRVGARNKWKHRHNICDGSHCAQEEGHPETCFIDCPPSRLLSFD